MKPLASASSALPPSAVRTDPAAAITLARFVPGLLRAAPGRAAADHGAV